MTKKTGLQENYQYSQRRWSQWMSAAMSRRFVIKAGTLAALGGSAALSQLMAACAGGGAQIESVTGVSGEGSYKWSKYPMIDKYNYRNLPWTTTPYIEGLSVGRHGSGAATWDFVRLDLNSYGCLLDTVVAKRYGPGVDMQKDELEGHIADRWSHAPDYSYYDFHVRPKVYFHDIPPVNGRLLTAQDVKYNWEVYRERGVQRSNLQVIDRIEVLSDKETVRVHLKRPVLWLPSAVANSNFRIFAPEHFEGPKERWERQPIGTGPFKMVFQNVGDRFESVRHERFHERFVGGDPRYPGYQRPFMRGEKSFQLAGGAAEIAAFRSGQLDHFRPADFTQLQDIVATHPNSNIQIAAQGQSALWSFNMRDALFQDVRVRRALNMALDRRPMIDTLYGGMGQGTFRYSWMFLDLADPPTPEELAEQSPWQRYDPARARALLAEAGYPNGFEMEYLLGDVPSSRDIMTQQYLEQIGVRLVFNQVESVVATAARINRTFKHTTSAASQLGFEPTAPARAFYIPDSPTNYGSISDPLMIDLAEKISYSLDADEQLRLIWQMHERELDQAYHLNLVQTFQNFVRQSWLHNMASASTGHFDVFSHHQYQVGWIDDTAPAERRGRLKA